MQCSRCGYFNTPSAVTCVKCNTPISKTETRPVGGRKTQALPNQEEVEDFLKKTMTEKPDSSNHEFSASKTTAESPDNDFSASKTIAEKPSNNNFSASKTVSDFSTLKTGFDDRPVHDNNFQTQREQPHHSQKAETVSCPLCNYPISGVAKFCPSCNHDLSKPINIEPPKQKRSKMKERNPQKTVNIFAMDESIDEEKVMLTEIKQNGQKDIELTSEGKKIYLNKESLEQENNPAISENVHAELINFEGDWYIVNRTSAGTTFVAANKPRKLTKDDMILVGNTLYRFNG